MISLSVPQNFRRIFAYILDKLLLGIIWLPVIIQIFQSWMENRDVAQIRIGWNWIVLCFVLQFAYRVFFLQMLGGTPGMLLLGLRLVPRADAERPLLWSQAFLRVLSDHLALFFGQGLFALALFRFDRTHLSDWVAETRMVQYEPRSVPARPRVFWGLFFVIYLSLSGFLSAYRFVQHCQFTRQELVIHRFQTED